MMVRSSQSSGRNFFSFPLTIEQNHPLSACDILIIMIRKKIIRTSSLLSPSTFSRCYDETKCVIELNQWRFLSNNSTEAEASFDTMFISNIVFK